MWLNWKWIAPKVRSATEKSDSVTLVDFFEKRLGGNWAIGRLVTSGMPFWDGFFDRVAFWSALLGRCCWRCLCDFFPQLFRWQLGVKKLH